MAHKIKESNELVLEIMDIVEYVLERRSFELLSSATIVHVYESALLKIQGLIQLSEDNKGKDKDLWA